MQFLTAEREEYVDGLPQSPGMCSRSGSPERACADRRADRSAFGNGRDPAAGVPRRRPGPLVHVPQGLPLSHAGKPLRHNEADAVPVPRYARRRQAIGETSGRPGRSAAAADELRQAPLDGLACLAQTREAGPRAGVPDDDRSASPTQILARRRRGLHYFAASLYGRSPQPGADAFEPRHVSRATQRQPVRAAIGMSGFIIRSIAASACTMPRPWN